MATLTFGEIAKKRYRSFDRMAEDKAKLHVDTVKYIEGIAKTAGVDISLWDAKEVFGTGTGNELITDRGKINEVFFQEMERRAAAAPPVVQEVAVLTEAQLTAIAAAETRLVQTQIAQAQQQRDLRISEAHNHYREYEHRIRLAAEQETTRRRLAAERTPILDQIRTVDQSDFWVFIGLDPNNTMARFKTRRPIVLEHRNPAMGTDITVAMGTYTAEYYFGEARIRVRQGENNLSVDGYIHPHINVSGEICWGSAGPQAASALSRHTIVEPFQLLAAVLSGYNSGSPYRHLERFYDVRILPEEQSRMSEMAVARFQAQTRITEAVRDRQVSFDSIPNPLPSVPASIPAEEVVVTPAAEAAPEAVVPPTETVVVEAQTTAQ